MDQGYLAIIAASLGIIGTIAGTLMGYFLNKRSHREETEDRIKSTRMLIRLEIDKNLEMLNELWLDMINLDSNNYEEIKDEENTKVNLAYKLAHSNLPSWMYESWKSQFSFVPIALNENEIKNITDFYSDLDNIESIYNSLSSLMNQDEENYRAHQLKPRKSNKNDSLLEFISNIDYPPSRIFPNRAPFFWERFEKSTLKLIENGNPLNKTN